MQAPGRIVLAEATFRDGQHAAVNAGVIEAILRADTGRPVRFCATPAHWDAVGAMLPHSDHDRVDVVPIRVDPAGGIRLRRGLRQLGILLATTSRTDDCLIVLSSSPETFFACRLACWLRPRLRIFVILHGNLVQATERRSRDPRRRLVDYTAGLRASSHPRIRLIVLEAAIQRAMADTHIPGWDRTLVLPHPVNAAEFSAGGPPGEDFTLTLGFIGHAKRSKGFANFLNLAKSARAGGLPYRFVLAGFLADRFAPEDLAGVQCPREPLSRAAFLQAVAGVDYACFPYPAAFYALTASGSLLDTACALKPVIAMAFPALLDIVREFGPIGFVCATEDEMGALLADPTRLADAQAYAGFQANLQRLRQQRLPSALASQMTRILGSSVKLRRER